MVFLASENYPSDLGIKKYEDILLESVRTDASARKVVGENSAGNESNSGTADCGPRSVREGGKPRRRNSNLVCFISGKETAPENAAASRRHPAAASPRCSRLRAVLTGSFPSLKSLPTPPPIVVGPTPQISFPEFSGERKTVGLMSPSPNALSDRNHRLNVQDPLRGVVGADTEIKVVLEWDADEIGDRVLRFFGQSLCLGLACRLGRVYAG